MTDDAYNDSTNISNDDASSSSSLPSNSLVVPLHLLGILSYLSLLGWFSNRMKQSGHYHNSSSSSNNNNNNNTLEEWIGRTIAVGLCAVVLRCLEYLLFDHTGSRHPFVAIVTAFGNATKHGLTRALLVGLSTGVGVLPSRLGCGTLLTLVALTLVYIAVVTGLDYWAFQDQQQQQQQQEDTKHDENDNSSAVRTVLLAAKAFTELLFWCWMWIALCRTMTDLRRMDRPIFRYRALFWILLLLAVVSGAVLGAVITERTDYGSIGLANNRGLSQLDEVCVFFMLLTAAILWRPGQIMSPSSPANTSGQRSNLRRHHEQNDLELMRSITTESNPDIPEDSPLVKDETTFA